jgi:hypothetical protein
MLSLIRVLALVLVLVSVVGSAYAQMDETEEARLNAEKAKRRHYAGGKDEQELTVQAVLPVPTRYPQDVKPAAAGAAKEQTQDDLHD